MEHETRLYICELHNVESLADQLDFGNGLKLKQVAGRLVRRIDRATRRLVPHWADRKPWFLVNEHSVNEKSWVDGDPSGALRVFKSALLLYFGEGVQFGPDVHVSKQLLCYAIGPIIYRGGDLSQVAPNCRPDEFRITSGDIGQLTTLFNQLIQGFRTPLVRVALERFITASGSRAVPSDSIVDQSIALEALYLLKDNKKGETLAQRGAVFLGSNDRDREEIYINLRSFYKARNKILHEGETHPTVKLKTGTPKDAVQLRDWCFKHLREAIRKLLDDNRYFTMNKDSFISELGKTAQPWGSQFKCVDKQNFYP